MKIPKGWKLVPVEPTEEMLEAALVYSSYGIARKQELQESVATDYRLMLAAAPTPPAQHADDDAHTGYMDDNNNLFLKFEADQTFSDEIIAKLHKLYTHPQSDELRKAAEEAFEVLDGVRTDHIDVKFRLCAALEKK